MFRELQDTFEALSSFRVLQEGSRPSEGRVVSNKKQEPPLFRLNLNLSSGYPQSGTPNNQRQQSQKIMKERDGGRGKTDRQTKFEHWGMSDGQFLQIGDEEPWPRLEQSEVVPGWWVTKPRILVKKPCGDLSGTGKPSG